ncbi:hypothetical protein ACLSZC_09360, partial [Avibacterium avium]|uniref:hypothetical protein n=1 Tax=Avibacterium avium TaxID=751 RepID=UPI003BF80B0A
LVFTYIAVSNQSDTLKNVKNQINNEKHKLELCLEKKDVSDTYKQLEKRIEKQKKILCFIRVIIFITGIICIAFYLKQSDLIEPLKSKISFIFIHLKSLLCNTLSQ